MPTKARAALRNAQEAVNAVSRQAAELEMLRNMFQAQIRNSDALTNAIKNLLQQSQNKPAQTQPQIQPQTQQQTQPQTQQQTQPQIQPQIQPQTKAQPLSATIASHTQNILTHGIGAMPSLMSAAARPLISRLTAGGAAEAAEGAAGAAGEAAGGMGALGAGVAAGGIAAAGILAYQAVNTSIQTSIQQSLAKTMYKATINYSNSYIEKASKTIQTAFEIESSKIAMWGAVPIVGSYIKKYKTGTLQAATKGELARLQALSEFEQKGAKFSTMAIPTTMMTSYKEEELREKARLGEPYGINMMDALSLIQRLTAGSGLKESAFPLKEAYLYQQRNPYVAGVLPQIAHLSATGEGVVQKKDANRLFHVLESQGITGARVAEQMQGVVGALSNIARQGGHVSLHGAIRATYALGNAGVGSEALAPTISGMTGSAQGLLRSSMNMVMPSNIVQNLLQVRAMSEGGGTIMGMLKKEQEWVNNQDKYLKAVKGAAGITENPAAKVSIYANAGMGIQAAMDVVKNGEKLNFGNADRVSYRPPSIQETQGRFVAERNAEIANKGIMGVKSVLFLLAKDLNAVSKRVETAGHTLAKMLNALEKAKGIVGTRPQQ